MRNPSLPILVALALVSCGGGEKSEVATPARSGGAVTAAPKGNADNTENAKNERRLEREHAEREAALQAKVDELEDRLSAIEATPPPAAARNAPPRPSQPSGPDPAVVYSIPIDGNPLRGAKNAKITIVKGFEFACPFCHKSRATLDELLKAYKGEIRVVYKSFLVHTQVATAAALAACAAGKQGKFEKMANAIWTHGFEKYRDDRDPTKMSEASMRGLAKRYARVKMSAYDRDLNDCAAVIAKDEADLRRVGVTGTPAFFINGRYIRGAQPTAVFRALIDDELALANDRISAGEATEASYYETFVLNAGKTSN